MLRTVLFAMSLSLLVPQLGARAQSFDARARADRVATLLQMKLPLPFESGVNCHGTTFFTNGLLNFLIPIDTTGTFTADCFTEEAEPSSGAIGVFSLKVGRDIVNGHSFTVLDQARAFHKPNPGSENPFQTVEISPGSKARDAFASSYQNSDLEFYRYSPGPGCWINSIRAKIEEWKSDPELKDVIRILEAASVGRVAAPDPFPYHFRLKQLESLWLSLERKVPDPHDPRWILLAVYGKFLHLPIYKMQRQEFEIKYRARAERVYEQIRAAAARSTQLTAAQRRVLREARVSYPSALGLDGDAKTGFLEIDREDFDRLKTGAFETPTIHVQIQDGRLFVRGRRSSWLFIFSHTDQFFLENGPTPRPPGIQLRRLMEDVGEYVGGAI